MGEAVLLAEPVKYYTCKNQLSSQSMDNCKVLVDNQIASIIYCYGSVESRNSRLTAILRSNDLVNSTGKRFGITLMF